MKAVSAIFGFATMTAFVGAAIKLGVELADLELSWRGAFGLSLTYWIVRIADRAVWQQAEAVEARKLDRLDLR